MLEEIIELLPFIIPFAIIQIGLMVAALMHIFKHNTYKIGNRVIWIVLCFVGFIGPILYFAIGKGDE
jgi:heme/copper-type cytochrome/quinol oxidase subunit 4